MLDDNGTFLIDLSKGASQKIGPYKVDVEAVLGEGSFGGVYRVKVLEESESGDIVHYYAIKKHKTLKPTGEPIEVQFQSLNFPDSPYFIRKYGHIDDGKHQKIEIFELGGKDLSELFQSGVLASKPGARAVVFRDMFHGVWRMHKDSFIHWDLKPENFVFSLDGNTIKIIDLAGASRKTTDAPLATRAWSAPEVIHKTDRLNYKDVILDEAADVYSMGLMLFRAKMGVKVDDLQSLTEKCCGMKVVHKSAEGLLQKTRAYVETLEDGIHKKEMLLILDMLAEKSARPSMEAIVKRWDRIHQGFGMANRIISDLLSVN